MTVLYGCGGGASLLHETERGGVAAYPYVPERGPVVSSFRRDAVTLMNERCNGHYRIVHEGEVRSRTRVSGVVQGADEVIRDRRWGIQFECQ